MFRKLFFVLCAVSLTLASCGRQVTPNRAGTSANGLPPTTMLFKFNTAGNMDFSKYAYVIALNTTYPSEGEPYASNAAPGGNTNSWYGYSFEIIVTGSPNAVATVIQFVPQQGQPTVRVPRRVTDSAANPQLLQLQYPCAGSTQFCLQVDRHVFAGLGGVTPGPSPSASASPSGSPSPSPSPTATPSGSPSPSASPSAAPTSAPISGTWYINWFTAYAPQSGLVAPGQPDIIDAPQGVNDRSWLPSPNQTYNTATSFDWTWQALAGWPQVSDQAAQLAGGEVINAP